MTPLATLSAADADLTAALGRALAAMLRPGDTVLLNGPVGAGKTHLARALIRARQGDSPEDVPSPTFTLVQTYDDPHGSEIWHADLYRLTHPDELIELGLDEARSTAICLIEWPDRMDLDPDALTVTLTPVGDLRDITLTGDPARWQGVDRIVQIARYLHDAGWAGARVEWLAGDASARRYFRVTGDGPAVLMDAPPGSCGSYLAMTDWLRSRGFHAPELLAPERDGLLLIEDLGDDLVARIVARDPAQATPIYTRIAQLLADLHRHAPPDFVAPLDAVTLAEQVGLFGEWYVPATGADPALAAPIGPMIHDLHDQLCTDAAVTCLRDFHAENILLTDDNSLGLLDFQDAVAAHPAYDLVSMLHDARRSLTPQTKGVAMSAYLTATGADPDRFGAAFALLGAQRNLRIMGIFTRLCIRDGKPRYLDFMPHVWTLIGQELAHPALADLRAVLAQFQGPDRQIIERIKAQCPTK